MSRRLKLLMMGTGEFALPTFLGLYATRHDVIGLCTQPDRTGRGHHQHVNPLKEAALSRGTPVFQPDNVNLPESLGKLREFGADVFIVAAYGQILSKELLTIPSVATINVHASLLPKYRGASPVAYAIWKGESETGVSIIQVLPALDAGPILAVARTPITPTETSGELEDRLAQLAVPLIGPVLDQLTDGSAQSLPQDAALVTRAPKLKKDQGAIDWTRPAREVDWHIRAMQPWPNPYSFLHRGDKPPQRMLILGVNPLPEHPMTSPAGTIVQSNKRHAVVQTGSGAVELLRIQPEGKRPMATEEFLRGYPLQPGDRFSTA